MTIPPQAVRAQASAGSLRIRWTDGSTSDIPSVWLRDNLPGNRDPGNGQRLLDIADLPPDPHIRKVEIDGDELRVHWQDDAPPGVFALPWLRSRTASVDGRPENRRHLWLHGAQLQARRDFSWLGYDALRSDDKARLAWLTQLHVDGIAFLDDVPCVDAGILDAMVHVGRVTETNYGRVFDVRTVGRPENLAYTDLGLGLHTDNPYREPVPGFQVLHALASAPEGGDSLFADGHALALHLRETAPEEFATLTSTPVPFFFRSADAELYAARPLIQLTCDGTISSVHYNNRSIAPLPATRGCEAFYRGYRRFATLLRDPRFSLRTHLDDGQLVVFDNQRVLHGRTGFVSAVHPRHLRGCYLARDSVASATSVLRRKLQEEPKT